MEPDEDVKLDDDQLGDRKLDNPNLDRLNLDAALELSCHCSWATGSWRLHVLLWAIHAGV